MFQRPSEKQIQESHAYQKASNKAESYLNDPEKLQGLLEQASTKAAHHKSGQLEALWDDLTTLLRMLHAYGARKYTAIPVSTLLMLVTTVAYFVMPDRPDSRFYSRSGLFRRCHADRADHPFGASGIREIQAMGTGNLVNLGILRNRMLSNNLSLHRLSKSVTLPNFVI